MRPFTWLAVLASISFGVPALAAPAPPPAKVAHGHGHAVFPMKGADFKTKVDGKIAKARTRMEAEASKLPADQAKELRAKFDATVANVNKELNAAIADGTVTQDEAKRVRAAAKPLRHGHARAKS